MKTYSIAHLRSPWHFTNGWESRAASIPEMSACVSSRICRAVEYAESKRRLERRQHNAPYLWTPLRSTLSVWDVLQCSTGRPFSSAGCARAVADPRIEDINGDIMWGRNVVVAVVAVGPDSGGSGFWVRCRVRVQCCMSCEVVLWAIACQWQRQTRGESSAVLPLAFRLDRHDQRYIEIHVDISWCNVEIYGDIHRSLDMYGVV